MKILFLGSFGGANATSNLSILFMEEVSCNSKNEKFFNSIKTLRLQECRTLGLGKIEANESADFHTGRVGNVLDEDNLTQSFADLNNEFSETLNQDNPLSSRDLIVFLGLQPLTRLKLLLVCKLEVSSLLSFILLI